MPYVPVTPTEHDADCHRSSPRPGAPQGGTLDTLHCARCANLNARFFHAHGTDPRCPVR